jgi:hypothetical protein
VFTNNKNKLGSHTASVVLTSTYLGTTYTTSWNFSVTIVDPCSSTVITTWTIAAMTVKSGETVEYTFTEALDSI